MNETKLSKQTVSNTVTVKGAITNYSDKEVCDTYIEFSKSSGYHGMKYAARTWQNEARRRGLDCGFSNQKSPAEALYDKSSNIFVNYDSKTLCKNIELYGQIDAVQEAKRRGLSCGLNETATTQISTSNFNPTTAAENRAEQGLVGFIPQGANVQKFDAASICAFATTGLPASWDASQTVYIQEAKRRGLSCGVGETTQTTATTAGVLGVLNVALLRDNQICEWLGRATNGLSATIGAGAKGRYEEWALLNENDLRKLDALLDEGYRRGLSCSHLLAYHPLPDSTVCDFSTLKIKDKIYWAPLTTINASAAQVIAKMRGLNCGVGELPATQMASASPQSGTATSAELEAERRKRAPA